MKVKLEDIKKLCKIIVDQAENSGFNELNLTGDYYWTIKSEDREDFSKDTPIICVGSLHDDIEYLEKILEGSNPATIIDFDRLANLLSAIGNEISKSEKPFLI